MRKVDCELDYFIMLQNAEADQYDKNLKKEVKMPSPVSLNEMICKEEEIISALSELNKRVKEIIAENKCESPKELLQKALHEKSLYEAIGEEHDKLIQETKSHAEDSRRHLLMISELRNSLGKLTHKINHFRDGINDRMMWRNKARIIIAELCAESYRQTNYKDGKKYKRHRAYSVPSVAEQLINCLDRNDEHEAKRIFLLINNYKTESIAHFDYV